MGLGQRIALRKLTRDFLARGAVQAERVSLARAISQSKDGGLLVHLTIERRTVAQ